jgi:excisionase family DNA binding protein
MRLSADEKPHGRLVHRDESMINTDHMRLIPIREVAKITSLSMATIRRLISSGQLPSVRPSSRSIRIRETDLLAYLEQRSMGAK